MNTDESLYHVAPQVKGRIAHSTVDNRSATTKRSVLMSLSVFSETLGLIGKIDLYKMDTKTLIERKYQLKQIYRGQIYQLWAQYFCLLEMGYEIEHLMFYEISTNKTTEIALPDEHDRKTFEMFIHQFRTFDPETPLNVNKNKCQHCIYCNLCDKTESENVYT